MGGMAGVGALVFREVTLFRWTLTPQGRPLGANLDVLAKVTKEEDAGSAHVATSALMATRLRKASTAIGSSNGVGL